ncbi:DEAD/DEAH box helicase [Cupriavidus metallidurans]|uniref:DEAD/DEAH box helicase n=1 Tax=Cupriavidus metallidurans TaxID=119219 RepID=UPI001CCF48B8|nr:helicase-related protein [Cupriavidus metallidurans]UBM12778.1 DEAD/DEAH box helicase family protein [Cupriavidus metallidurans]
MSRPAIVIAHNAVVAKLFDAPREAKLLVQRALSYQVDGFASSNSFSKGCWDGRSSFFNFNQDTFPRGFVPVVAQQLASAGYQVRLHRDPLPAPLGPAVPDVDAFGYSDRYDFQYETFKRLERHGQMIAQIATGGGKSRTARLCIARIARRTLFLTTRSILMHQMADDMVTTFGKEKIGVLGDGKFKPALYNCATVQTIAAALETLTVKGVVDAALKRMVTADQKKLDAMRVKALKSGENPNAVAARMQKIAESLESQRPTMKELRADAEKKVAAQDERRNNMIEFLQSIEFLILEEAHEAASNEFYSITQHCSRAYYRLALTATPFMKDSEEANMRLMAASGPVAIQVSEAVLIGRGILAKPYFRIIKDIPAVGIGRSTPYQRARELGIVRNDWRNRAAVFEVKRAMEYGLTSMILVQLTEHGDIMLDLLKAAGVRAMYIRGENNQAERKRALNALRNGDIDCLVGTTILDVGVDVPAVGLVIKLGGGKAEVADRQRIGRGARAKKVGPNIFFVVDFRDEVNNHLRGHARERLEVIESTPGFAEGLVEDFPYEALGLQRIAA